MLRSLLVLVACMAAAGCVSAASRDDDSETSGVAASAACGAGSMDGRELAYGDTVAIAADGTVFHGMSDAGDTLISRTRPGAATEYAWLTIGPGARGVRSLAIAPNGKLYALVVEDFNAWIEVIDTTASAPAHTVLGAVYTESDPAPADLTVSPSGELFVGGFFGLARVDLSSGRRTIVRPNVQIRNVVHTGTSLIALTYDQGLVRFQPDGSGLSVVHTFANRGFDRVGVDALGRFYFTEQRHLDGHVFNRLVRFDATFAQEEVLLSSQTTSGEVLGDFAFGHGALACDVYVASWRQGFRVTGAGAAGGRS